MKEIGVPRILAKGFKPSFSTTSPEASTTALAPSLSVDELAAVTVPFSLTNAGFKLLYFSLSNFLYSSSSLTTTSPFLVLTVTGAISSSNSPVFQEFSDRSYEERQWSSCSSRVIPTCLAVCSAQFPMANLLYTSNNPSTTRESFVSKWPKAGLCRGRRNLLVSSIINLVGMRFTELETCFPFRRQS